MRRLFFVMLMLAASPSIHAEDPAPGTQLSAIPMPRAASLATTNGPAQSKPELEQKRKELEALQEEVLRLGGTIGHPTRVRISIRAIELNRTKLNHLRLPHPFHSVPKDGDGLADEQNRRKPSSNALISYAGDEELLQALEPLVANGCVQLLASPTVITHLGQSTTVNCFRELPRHRREEEGTIHSKSPGFGMEVLPRQTADGEILLDLFCRFVIEDNANSVSISGRIVPGVSTRSIKSTIQIKSGKTMIAGGLVGSRRVGTTASEKVCPTATEGPTATEAGHEFEETELIFCCTAELVPAG